MYPRLAISARKLGHDLREIPSVWRVALDLCFAPQAQKYVDELLEVHQRVQFEAKGTQKKLNALRKRAAAAAEDEARCLDAELVIARRQKLKDLYASDFDRYQVELEAMGLSLNFE